MLEKYFENVENKDWISFFERNFEKYEINTDLRICHFLAQAFHETRFLEVLQENLYYSVDGLKKIFPKYFRPNEYVKFANKPVEIANRVYANRIGNGNEMSGDGYKFRGRGIFQFTGKANYKLYGIENPNLLLSCNDSNVNFACIYWVKNDLNKLADKNDIEAITKRINGGFNGLEDRKKIFDELYNI